MGIGMEEMALSDLSHEVGAETEPYFVLVADKKQLLSTLSLVQGVVDKKNVISILSNIKLSASDNGLTITATDMDLSICQRIGADVRFAGEITADCRTIADIVRKMPDQNINLRYDADSSQLVITGKSCVFNLPTLPASEFPSLELSSSDAVHFEIPAIELAKMLEYTKYSIANESNRYNLNGVCLHKSLSEGADRFAAASSDGHRLSYVSVQSPLEVIKLNDILLPRKSVFELIKILKDQSMIDFSVEIAITSTKAKFSCRDTVLVSKLIDGVFPDYRIFIPEKTIGTLLINRKFLMEAVDRVSTVTVEKFRAVQFDVNSDRIEISAHGNSSTKAREILEYVKSDDLTVSYEGQNFIRSFNPVYLNDILSTSESENILIHFGYNDQTPTLIKEEENEHALFVIMPLIG